MGGRRPTLGSTIQFNNKILVMLKWQSHMRSTSELLEIQKVFLREINYSDQKIVPLELPFYNFVCYTIDLLLEFTKTTYDATFNIFMVDSHIRKYNNPVQLYRRFMGYLNSWKKYWDTDEGRLYSGLLKRGRNERKHVRLFLRLRKILLKTINHKILQEISLTHQDAVTIVHTMNMVNSEQKRTLTKKINEYFISRNAKYNTNAKFNSAIICEYFMAQINDKSQGAEEFKSNLPTDSHLAPQKQQEVEEALQMSNQFYDHYTYSSLPKKQSSYFENKQNSEQMEDVFGVQEKTLVNLDQCLRQLTILKQKDMQIDNRFKKLNLSRPQY